jgi:hypothetical protein
MFTGEQLREAVGFAEDWRRFRTARQDVGD